MKPISQTLLLCALLTASQFANAQTFAIKNYLVNNVTLVSESELQTVLSPYIGTDKDFETIQSAIAAVENYYSEKGYGAVKAMLPEQDIEDGQRGGPANQDIWLSEISASMGDGNRLPRSRSNEKTPP